MTRWRGLAALFDISAQTHDEIINGARVGIFVQVPDIFQDGFSRNGMADILDQIAKQLRFHQRELKGLAADLQSQILEIDDLIPEAKVSGAIRAARYAVWRMGGAAPCQTLRRSRLRIRAIRMERLNGFGKIIVGARIQTHAEHLPGRDAGRQHQQGNVVVCRAQLRGQWRNRPCRAA